MALVLSWASLRPVMAQLRWVLDLGPVYARLSLELRVDYFVPSVGISAALVVALLGVHVVVALMAIQQFRVARNLMGRRLRYKAGHTFADLPVRVEKLTDGYHLFLSQCSREINRPINIGPKIGENQ